MVCFVCLNGKNLISNICLCKSFVHQTCFDQMIVNVPYFSEDCIVCKSKYTNVTRTSVRIISPQFKKQFTIAVLFCGVFLMSGFFYVLVYQKFNFNFILKSSFIMFVFGIFSFVFCLYPFKMFIYASRLQINNNTTI